MSAVEPAPSQKPDRPARRGRRRGLEVVFVHEAGTGRVLQVSPSVERLLGVPLDQVLAEPEGWTWRIHQDDRGRVRAALGALLAGGPFEEDYRVVDSHGGVRWVHDRGVPLTGDVPHARQVRVVCDLSDARSLEDQLLQAQRMESAALLARGVSHDYNNLLMGLVGCANLALKAVPQESGARPWLDEIKVAALEGAELSRSLVLFAAGGEANGSHLELGEALPRASKLLRTLLGEEIEFRMELAEGPLIVEASFGQLQQVLLNLGTNARDAIDGAGEVILRTARERVEAGGPLPPGDYAVLSLRDSGRGMPEEVRRRVFEPFFSAQEHGGSTGLGLTTVDLIVRRRGGDVAVTSSPGVGATVTLRLPLWDPPPEPTPPPPAVSGPRGTVLLVEDDARVRRALRAQLELGGHTVLDAWDAASAILRMREHAGAVDAVVSDVMLPGTTGGAVACTLDAICPGTPVLFVSAHRPSMLLRDGSVPAGSVVLQKPVAEELLLREVARLLESKR